MVIMNLDLTGCTMTCRAVPAYRILGTSVRGLCHVQKMEKVGAFSKRISFAKPLGVMSPRTRILSLFLMVNK